MSPTIVRHLREHGKFLKYAETTVANCSLEPEVQMVEEVQILLSRVLMLSSGWLLAAALTTTYVNECVLVRSAMD